MEQERQILSSLEVELKESMVALSNNPAYKRMIELDDQIENIKAKLRADAKEHLKNAVNKTIDTELVRITLATRKNFKAKNLAEVDSNLLDIKLDNKKVANHLSLYGELTTGVTMTETEYIIWKDKK